MTKDKLKIVVSDIDGTLINDKDELPTNFIEMVDKLNDLGIIFAAASGRGVESIKHKLSYQSDNLYILSDNGAMVTKGDDLIHVNSFSREDYLDLVEMFQAFDDITIAVATPTTSYVTIPHPDIDLGFLDEYYHVYEIVEDLKDCYGEFVSFSVHCENGSIAKFNSDVVQDRLDRHSIVVSGEKWIDAIPPNTNKGATLKHLIESLNIKQDETIAFGDYNNDVEMLDFVYRGYAMQDATPAVKAVADEVIGSNNDNSVIKKIYEILEV